MLSSQLRFQMNEKCEMCPSTSENLYTRCTALHFFSICSLVRAIFHTHTKSLQYTTYRVRVLTLWNLSARRGARTASRAHERLHDSITLG